MLTVAFPLFSSEVLNFAFGKTGGTEEGASGILKVSPFRLVVEDVNSTLPLVDVMVENVEDLYAWQIKLYFDASVLNLTQDRVWYPEGHIFAYKKFVSTTPVVASDKKGFYVFFGASLLGEEESFSGSGTLCRMNFTGVAAGTSSLNFSTPVGIEAGTCLLNSELKPLLIELMDGKKKDSSLTLQTDRDSLLVGLTVSVTGVLTPKKADAEINLYYKSSEIKVWHEMASVETDLEGGFSYTWKPPTADTYWIVAEWRGDVETNPAVSPVLTITVKEPPPSKLPQIILSAFLVILVVLVAYLVKREKERLAKEKQNSSVPLNNERFSPNLIYGICRFI